MTFAYGEPRELAPAWCASSPTIPTTSPSRAPTPTWSAPRTSRPDRPGPRGPRAPRRHPRRPWAGAGSATCSSPTRTATTPTACRRCWPPPAPRPPASAAALANRGTKRTSPSGSEFVDQDFVPDVPLADGGRLEGDGWAFTAVHTPGHAPDHLCFALEGTNILFSGDHVMGWNTSVVAPPEGNMGDYMRSLERLTERSDGVYFPGPRRPGRGAAAPGQGLPAAPAHARAGDPRVHPRRHQHGPRHRAGDLQGPRPQAPQRCVSFCPRAR